MERCVASLIVVCIAAAIIGSMAVAMAYFVDYKPQIQQASSGERVHVGPNAYTVAYMGTQDGVEEAPGVTFAKISVETGSGSQPPERRQLALVDKKPPPTPPSHGVFDQDGGLVAYFPLQGEFDEQFEYVLMIRPTKDQGSSDLAVVCIANCQSGPSLP